SWLKDGLAIFNGMAKEEVAEFIAAAKVKKGIHASAVAASPQDASNVIMKAFASKDAEIDRLNKRIEEILAEPLPAKTAGQYGLIAVSKEDDAAGNGTIGKAAPAEQELVAALERMAPDERALLLTKAALMMPRPATMVPAR
uniref:hypothetical protein n=1 Tax=Bradyrhizobium sp. TaxID=376 RepID=UPI002624556A